MSMRTMTWLVLATMFAAGPAAAKVNCDLVRKNMSRPGATVEDISMTMVIPEEEIRKCLEEDKAGGDGEAKPEKKSEE